jgi:LmbE family N-acetylglucosaminyl deacetylase
MIPLRLGRGPELKVLCLGCHSDDIEIGCGGTVLKLIEDYQACQIQWVVFAADGVRRAEAQRGAELFAGRNLAKGPRLNEFPDSFMPFVGREIKQVFEDLKSEISPDVVLTHYGQDAHQDHRLISELTWNTFRNHLILEYEIPKYDGDMGRPNFFVPLATEQYQKKVQYIVDTFESQRGKRWFEDQTFLALMRLRGMECNSPSGYAEAFYCRKAVL